MDDCSCCGRKCAAGIGEKCTNTRAWAGASECAPGSVCKPLEPESKDRFWENGVCTRKFNHQNFSLGSGEYLQLRKVASILRGREFLCVHLNLHLMKLRLKDKLSKISSENFDKFY